MDLLRIVAARRLALPYQVGFSSQHQNRRQGLWCGSACSSYDRQAWRRGRGRLHAWEGLRLSGPSMCLAREFALGWGSGPHLQHVG